MGVPTHDVVQIEEEFFSNRGENNGRKSCNVPSDLLQSLNSADVQVAVSYLSQKVWRQGRTLGVR